MPLKAWPVRPKGDKQARAEQVSGLISAGRIYVPDQAPWLLDFRIEIYAFPASRFNDQVDSLVNFLGYFDAVLVKIADRMTKHPLQRHGKARARVPAVA